MSQSFLWLDRYQEQAIIDKKLRDLIKEFYCSYIDAVKKGDDDPFKTHINEQMFERLIALVGEQIQHPYVFEIFHSRIRAPFDYYQFGLDLISPLIDFKHSKLLGINQINQIQQQLENNENVILMANHQTEPDPQIISLLLEKTHPKLAEEMIFVAGHRVISDPLAVPLSMGCNLLCIYSKKHMSSSPEEKEKKLSHNQRTIKKMGELLNQGGCCIYVAPSGGRDRLDPSGKPAPAPFDSQSIELFLLLAKKAPVLTHFYPLALKTYDLMPPPRSIEKDLGEKRTVNYTPVYLSFGKELNMGSFPGSEGLDKKTKSLNRSEWIWQQVLEQYQAFP